MGGASTFWLFVINFSSTFRLFNERLAKEFGDKLIYVYVLSDFQYI